MIELRWREVADAHPRAATPVVVADGVLMFDSARLSFVLEFRQWSDATRSYSRWTPVPIATLEQQRNE